MEITAAQMRTLLKEAGADSVSDEAAAELAQTLENYIGYISEEAVAQARDDERAVVTRDDIMAAEH